MADWEYWLEHGCRLRENGGGKYTDPIGVMAKAALVGWRALTSAASATPEAEKPAPGVIGGIIGVGGGSWRSPPGGITSPEGRDCVGAGSLRHEAASG